MKRFIPGILAIALGLGGAYYYFSSQSATGLASLAVEAQEATDADLSLVQEMSMGNPDASVTMIEYASFTCPHCKNFNAGPMKEIKANYIDTGKINFIYREVYFDRYGLWAGMVARCGGPLRYFGLTDMIYDRQAEWTKGEPEAVAANLRRIGKTAGLSDVQLDACMADGDKAKAMVAVWENNAEQDNVTSTPSFVVNGTNYSNMSYAEFATVLDKELGE